MTEIYDEHHNPGRRKTDKQPQPPVVHNWYFPIFRGTVYIGGDVMHMDEASNDEQPERPKAAERWR